MRKLKIFEFGAKGPLDQKFGPGVQITIWPRGPNCLKYDCWGPGESIDTHMMGPVENIPGKEAKMAKKANVIGFFF